MLFTTKIAECVFNLILFDFEELEPPVHLSYGGTG
jgi:hypothetical protein